MLLWGDVEMNKKRLLFYLSICLVFLLFLLAASYEDEILEIEEKNVYSWQKYMNEDEFNQLKKDMSYMDVVQIVGGAGEKIDADTYEWHDEILLTRGYKVQFKENQLLNKEIVERRGHSTR
jgi:hypothetical protein